jgi:succinate dehydrogenase / fumarate reductase membrane anchor subunit
MRYITDKKRVEGLGSSKMGTEHHISMKISSVFLLFLVPIFLFTFGNVIGEEYEAVISYYQKPFPAIVTLLTIVVGLLHFNSGVKVLLEDYVQGFKRELLILLMTIISWCLISLGVFSILKLAL